MLTVKEQAGVILDQLDIYAPAHINMNHREDWIAALVYGIAEVKRREIAQMNETIRREDKACSY